MSVSESQKKASAKWDAENTKTAACKLKNTEYAAFKSWAETRGLTVSGALLAYIRSCIAQESKGPHILTRNEIVSLASVHGKDQILEAVSKIDEADAKNYLMMILLLHDKMRELEESQDIGIG